MNPNQTLWQTFDQHTRDIFVINTIIGALDWDKNVTMPEGAAEQRGEQAAYLESHLHRLQTDQKFVELLRDLGEKSNTLTAEQAAAVKHQRQKTERKLRIPVKLVEECAKVSARAHETWVQARKESKFSIFEKDLTEILNLRIQVGKCLRTGSETPYEAILSEFEPQFPLQKFSSLFEGLRQDLAPLVAKVMQDKAAGSIPSAAIPIAEQEKLNRRYIEKIGFDFKQGRLDTSVHPFCGGGGSDTRLTTRYNAEEWKQSFYGCLHEAGHGMYEQGMERLAPSKAVRETPSMGLHESQSRFWENQIGRSQAFCEYLQKDAQDSLGIRLADSAKGLWSYVNQAKASYIRVEADELTYNLHILMRYEIESKLFSGELQVRDLPAFWWEKASSYLGLSPKSEALGCLQDIHWSMGAFGYFPSYAIGNLIAAQLTEAIQKDLPLLDLVMRGDFLPIREWLNRKIHAFGASQTTLEIVRAVTGAELSHTPFVRSMNAKYA